MLGEEGRWPGPTFWHMGSHHGWRGRIHKEAVYGAGGQGDTGKGHENIHVCKALCAWVLREGFLEEAALVPGLRFRSDLDKGIEVSGSVG